MVKSCRSKTILWFVVAVWLLIQAETTSVAAKTTHATQDPAALQLKTSSDDAVALTPLVTEPDPSNAGPSTVSDGVIESRLREILSATNWYRELRIDANRGVVFINGQTDRLEHKAWADDLCSTTPGVDAVVNGITIETPPFGDLTPARNELLTITRTLMRALPFFLLAVMICSIAWMFAVGIAKVSGWILVRRIESQLLVDVVARAFGFIAFLTGVYVALRVSGMTEVAATLLGGTGLLGLVVGIAFRDIAENLLASILISIQRPFALGDFIELQGEGGYVQSVTMRGTLLMTLNGNHVQIPNSIVYKSTIRNLTANPNIRLNFDLAISYSDSITRVQDLVLDVLKKHSAVLTDPEPLVLADTLGSTTIVLKVYFWINCLEHSKVKVRSALMRQVKRAAQDAGISLADRGREFFAPSEIPIRIVRESVWHASPGNGQSREGQMSPLASHVERASERRESSRSEGGLEAEGRLIAEQARAARTPDESTNLFEE